MKRQRCLLLVILLLAACSTLPVDNGKSVSHTFSAPESTVLGHAFGLEEENPSSFRLLVGGLDALKARLALAELAERSLDIQMYIWRMDQTGQALLQRVLLAADRGVRARILLDDVHAMDEQSVWLAADAHPRVEVRFFNPLGARQLPALDLVLDPGRINHRMHNKTMLFDGAVAIAGGRNIGDHYFGINVESNFRDLDLLAVGAAAAELGKAFDEYWNGPWALPVASLAGWAPDETAAGELLQSLSQQLPQIDELPVSAQPDLEQARNVVGALANSTHVANATVLVDPPGKVDNGHGTVMHEIDAAISNVQHELLVESAYFIPTDEHVRQFAGLVGKGVDVAVLTNSLATNDVVLAHSGYKNHQEALLAGGVNIFEFRPDAAADRRRWSILANESLASLHTKAFVFDRERTFVGSLNFDPRSRHINTENGVLVESRQLAGAVAELILAGMRPENSYRLFVEDGEVHWKSGDEVFDMDPETSMTKRAVTNLLRMIPVEDQL